MHVMTSQIYGLYDPLGLIVPVTIKYELLLKEFSVSGLAWDDAILEDLDESARTSYARGLEHLTAL